MAFPKPIFIYVNYDEEYCSFMSQVMFGRDLAGKPKFSEDQIKLIQDVVTEQFFRSECIRNFADMMCLLTRGVHYIIPKDDKHRILPVEVGVSQLDESSVELKVSFVDTTEEEIERAGFGGNALGTIIQIYPVFNVHFKQDKDEDPLEILGLDIGFVSSVPSSDITARYTVSRTLKIHPSLIQPNEEKKE
jgi:hypothetical protein